MEKWKHKILELVREISFDGLKNVCVAYLSPFCQQDALKQQNIFLLAYLNGRLCSKYLGFGLSFMPRTQPISQK